MTFPYRQPNIPLTLLGYRIAEL